MTPRAAGGIVLGEGRMAFSHPGAHTILDCLCVAGVVAAFATLGETRYIEQVRDWLLDFMRRRRALHTAI